MARPSWLWSRDSPPGWNCIQNGSTPNCRRRQAGYGRGERQQIETDHVEILSGVWRGVTLGSPIAMLIPNRDATLDRLDELPPRDPGTVI